MRAVKDQSAPIPEEVTSKLGGIIFIVRRAHSRINQATLYRKVWDWEDACSEGQSGDSLG